MRPLPSAARRRSFFASRTAPSFLARSLPQSGKSREVRGAHRRRSEIEFIFQVRIKRGRRRRKEAPKNKSLSPSPGAVKARRGVGVQTAKERSYGRLKGAAEKSGRKLAASPPAREERRGREKGRRERERRTTVTYHQERAYERGRRRPRYSIVHQIDSPIERNLNRRRPCLDIG